jgi:hypothetical protein
MTNLDWFAVQRPRRLDDREARQVDIVLSAHGARYQSYPELVSRIADAFDAIPADAVTFSQGKDCFGTSVKEASFNDFSIVLTSDDVPPSSAQPDQNQADDDAGDSGELAPGQVLAEQQDAADERDHRKHARHRGRHGHLSGMAALGERQQPHGIGQPGRARPQNP